MGQVNTDDSTVDSYSDFRPLKKKFVKENIDSGNKCVEYISDSQYPNRAFDFDDNSDGLDGSDWDELENALDINSAQSAAQVNTQKLLQLLLTQEPEKSSTNQLGSEVILVWKICLVMRMICLKNKTRQ